MKCAPVPRVQTAWAWLLSRTPSGGYDDRVPRDAHERTHARALLSTPPWRVTLLPPPSPKPPPSRPQPPPLIPSHAAPRWPAKCLVFGAPVRTSRSGLRLGGRVQGIRMMDEDQGSSDSGPGGLGRGQVGGFKGLQCRPQPTSSTCYRSRLRRSRCPRSTAYCNVYTLCLGRSRHRHRRRRRLCHRHRRRGRLRHRLPHVIQVRHLVLHVAYMARGRRLGVEGLKFGV
jgi:hypothetical protein